MKEHYLHANYATRTQNTHYDRKLVAHILEYCHRHALVLNGGKVLDVACGTGGFKGTFEDAGFSYYGVDIDNEKPESNILKLDCGKDRFPYADDSFDMVFFKMGIEHLTLAEIAHCLTEIKRVLAPGGAAVILTPDWEWMYRVFYNEYTHQTPFSPASMRTALGMNGLQCRVSESFIQLPVVWQYPFMKYVCDVVQLLYPLAKQYKFVRYSRDRIVLAVASK
jgi:ubiquinone/menaquinone biosynthesis C-methylase UbiE